MNWILTFVTSLLFLSPCIKPQQNYSKTTVFDCNKESLPYTCNGQHSSSCRAFLIFTAYSPYNTLLAIAALTSSDPTHVSIINNVTTFSVFPEGQEVVVPVNCMCSGHHYEAITTYRIISDPQTYSTIANKTYQGLSTCNSLMRANTYPESALLTGHKLRVPLRCACPTGKQGAVGTKFLLTYSIAQGDTLYTLSKRFNVSLVSISEANSLSDEISTIYPFTTILIPLLSEPSYSQTVSRGYNVTTSSYLPSPVHDVKSRSKRLLFVVGIAVGAFSLLIFFLSVLFFLFHKKIIPQSGGITPQDMINLEIASLDRALKEFKFSEIKKATGNFGSKSKINGSVHRADFKREVLAVKKSKGASDDEMKVLCKINHFNIVKLRGFCEHKDDMYLVYEYMANGTLRDWLSRRGTLSWIQRICIALDVANGLLYLHNFARPAYVHNDVNSNTILLDGNLRAKIAHFSLARPANYEDATKVMGSKGYLETECRDAGPTTLKVDVFAFGVMLLELMTEEDGRNITAILESQNAETELSQFISPENGGMKEYAVQMMKLSLSCLAQEPRERPNMVEVVSILLKVQCNIHKACSLCKQQEEN